MGLFRRVFRSPEPEPFDPYAIGARRSDPELGAFEPLPPGPKKIPGKTLLLYFVLAVAVIGIIREGSGRTLKVDGSCTKPAYSLSKTEVKSGGVLKWAAAGPAASSVTFAVDSTTVPTASPALLSGPTSLKGCKASGRFGILVPEGKHVLTVFLTSADGQVTTVGTTKLEIDDPRGP